MKKATKLKWMIICAVIMVMAGIVLIFTGMFVPPLGEIHPSVLTALGEFLTFSGSLFGLNTTYRIKTERMEFEGENKETSDKDIKEINNKEDY